MIHFLRKIVCLTFSLICLRKEFFERNAFLVFQVPPTSFSSFITSFRLFKSTSLATSFIQGLLFPSIQTFLFSSPPLILFFFLYALEKMSGKFSTALTNVHCKSFVQVFQIFQSKEFGATFGAFLMSMLAGLECIRGLLNVLSAEMV